MKLLPDRQHIIFPRILLLPNPLLLSAFNKLYFGLFEFLFADFVGYLEAREMFGGLSVQSCISQLAELPILIRLRIDDFKPLLRCAWIDLVEQALRLFVNR